MNKDKKIDIAELVCNLTRYCNIKEEYFASSFNLSPTQVRVLKLFTYTNSYSIKELCSHLQLSNGRITQIITTLENKNILYRKIDKKDKRNVIVLLKPKSKTYINNILKNYEELHKILLSEVPENETNKIIESLKILNNILERWIKEK
jgi:DNA-binding MarR family transcriptional regulator